MQINIDTFFVRCAHYKCASYLRRYPDETLRSTTPSSCYYGRLSLRIALERTIYVLENAAQHLILCFEGNIANCVS